MYTLYCFSNKYSFKSTGRTHVHVFRVIFNLRNKFLFIAHSRNSEKKFYFAFKNCVHFLWILTQAELLSSTNRFHLEEARFWFWLAILKRDAAQFATCPPSIGKKGSIPNSSVVCFRSHTRRRYTQKIQYVSSLVSVPFASPTHLDTHAHIHMRTISLFLIIIIRSLGAKATFLLVKDHPCVRPFDKNV